jgi:hypothetical protein
VNDQSLVPGPNPRLGKIHFKDWLSHSTSMKGHDNNTNPKQ